MGTKGKSPGSQHNPKGVNQGNTLIDPNTGQPIDVVTDVQGTRRLAVDANITAQVPAIEVELDYNNDSVQVGDPNTGATLKINPDGSIDANTEIDAADGDNIAIADATTGNKMTVNPDGSINVQIGTSASQLKSFYAEVTSVASATPTTVQTYTVPGGVASYLQKITFSGTNIATYELLVNASVVDRKRTWFNGSLNEEFDLSDFSKDGLPLVSGDVVTVRVTHSRPDLGDFNSRLQVVEI